MLVVGYHVAKTGGTTVMHHMKQHMGDDSYFGYGNFAATRAFFRGEAIWEELPVEQRQSYKMIFGHGVDQWLLHGLGIEECGLFTSIREPFSHFGSRFNHNAKMKKVSGETVSPREFLEKQGNNPISQAIYKNFHFLSDGQEFGETAVLNILKCFRFLSTTEKLTQQTKPLCDVFGIPAITGKSRVNKNKSGVGDITKEEIYDKCNIDVHLHEILSSDNWSNEVGYEPKLLEKGLLAIKGDISEEQLVTRAYKRLANFMNFQNTLCAARLELHFSQRQDCKKYAPIWSKKVDLRDALTEAQSEQAKALVYQRYGCMDAAEACLEKALRLAPAFIAAMTSYARLLRSQKRDAETRAMAERIMLLEPGHPLAAKILQGIQP